ncbi:hypothetical protein RL73_03250 [Liberibacter crescens]|nr:hypothetical protein RL73_03250 [Liberibacter crescens]
MRIANVRTEIAEVRTEISHVENRLSKEISSTRNDLLTEMKYNLILTFGALIAVALGLAGLMAKGFHWI